MYKVLDKVIIENEILPHLSTAKRGFETKSCLVEVINSIYLMINYINKDILLKEQMRGWIPIEVYSIGLKRMLRIGKHSIT